MPQPSGTARERLEAYRRCCAAADAANLRDATRQALGDRHFLLVARAAEVCGERLLYDLEPDLIAAYRRFLDKPTKVDPQCTAKGAIARALVTLDSQDVSFYLAGIGYRQPEPVWGGRVDTAVDLRASCAMGLAATAYPRALIELVSLLHDPEPGARAGAARAIACTEPFAAEAVLRGKTLAGDREPDVIGECLAALLQVAPDDSPPFVARFLRERDAALRELAALALGGSRLEPALHLLREEWESQPLKRDSDRVLLRAAALHRSEPAFDWLLSVVAEGDRTSAEMVIRELAAYRSNARLQARLAQAVQTRADDHLTASLRDGWTR
jgi:HEAT repeat protein